MGVKALIGEDVADFSEGGGDGQDSCGETEEADDRPSDFKASTAIAAGEPANTSKDEDETADGRERRAADDDAAKSAVVPRDSTPDPFAPGDHPIHHARDLTFLSI